MQHFVLHAQDRAGNVGLLLSKKNLISPPGGAILVAQNASYTLTTKMAPPAGEIYFVVS